MGRPLRSSEIVESEIGIYHVVSRCVRSAFLMGSDPRAEKSYEDRRKWVSERLVWLAKVFKIDIVSYCVMANHLHLILRNRPDLVANLTDEELVRAWWAVSPKYRRNGEGGKLTAKRLEKLLKDESHIDMCRERLSSVSWFMRYLKHPLALTANFEDGRSGHFFEGRFRVTPIQSIQHLSNAMVYVDLNPIRAGLATGIEDSSYTSGQLRYRAAKKRRALRKKDTPAAKRQLRALGVSTTLNETIDELLSPIQMREDMLASGPNSNDVHGNSQANAKDQLSEAVMSTNCSDVKRPRASDLGVLSINEEQYLALIDLIGRRTASKKRGSIPRGLPPILAQLGISDPEKWLAMYDDYAKARDGTFRSKVNSDEEAATIDLEFVVPSHTNQDAMM